MTILRSFLLFFMFSVLYVLLLVFFVRVFFSVWFVRGAQSFLFWMDYVCLVLFCFAIFGRSVTVAIKPDCWVRLFQFVISKKKIVFVNKCSFVASSSIHILAQKTDNHTLCVRHSQNAYPAREIKKNNFKWNRANSNKSKMLIARRHQKRHDAHVVGVCAVFIHFSECRFLFDFPLLFIFLFRSVYLIANC